MRGRGEEKLTCVEVQFGHVQCKSFAVLATETEDYDRLQLSLHHHLHHLTQQQTNKQTRQQLGSRQTLKQEEGPLVPPFLPLPPPPPPPPPSWSRDIAVWKLSSRKFPCKTFSEVCPLGVVETRVDNWFRGTVCKIPPSYICMAFAALFGARQRPYLFPSSWFKGPSSK